MLKTISSYDVFRLFLCEFVRLHLLLKEFQSYVMINDIVIIIFQEGNCFLYT